MHVEAKEQAQCRIWTNYAEGKLIKQRGNQEGNCEDGEMKENICKFDV